MHGDSFNLIGNVRDNESSHRLCHGMRTEPLSRVIAVLDVFLLSNQKIATTPFALVYGKDLVSMKIVLGTCSHNFQGIPAIKSNWSCSSVYVMLSMCY